MFLIKSETNLTVTIEVRCNSCGKPNLFILDRNQYNNWINGELIQNCFPELTSSEREMLISGTCGICFDNLFAEK